MSEERDSSGKLARYRGEVHEGSDNSAPYPVSRMAPAVELVDLAAEIAGADQAIQNRTHAQLRLIAEQIQGLQQKAQSILEEAQRDQDLHRAQCNFKRQPGSVYHLYRRPDGRLYFSMLAPEEWGGEPPHDYQGSYRLENDMSWSEVE